jgi:RNA polymerase sigma-70 factor (ECF subfamily)
MAYDIHPVLDSRLDRLVDKAQRGDGSALADLCAVVAPRVAAYMRRQLRNASDAEEATQDVLLKVIEALPRYHGVGEGFGAWTFAIARNHAIDYRHRQSRTTAIAPADMARAADAVSLCAEPRPPCDEHRVLHDLIAPLSKLHREILTLMYEFDMSPDQVGVMLGRSAASVRQEHGRARAKLLEKVERERRRMFGDDGAPPRAPIGPGGSAVAAAGSQVGG